METKIPKFILKLKIFDRGGVNGVIIDADSLAKSKDCYNWLFKHRKRQRIKGQKWKR